MNALVVHRAHPEPRYPTIGLELYCDIPNNILDKHRIIEGLHRYVSLVRSLQEWIHSRRRRAFGDLNQLFDPNQILLTDAINATPHLNRHASTLIVGSIVADGFTAWAERRDWHIYAQYKVILFTAPPREKGATVVHKCSSPADGGLPLKEVWKGDLDPRGLSVEPGLKDPQDDRQGSDRHFAPVLIEDLNKPAHVRAFELMWQVH